MGLDSPEKSPERSRRKGKQRMEVVEQPLTPAMVRSASAGTTLQFEKSGVKLVDFSGRSLKEKH